MPKPIFGENGSGMHTHMSLFSDGRNAFFDGDDQWHLSDVGKAFIAGQLRHAREISAVFAQWVNSYKRLVPGYEAPVYVAWSQRNRSALIRIPLYKPGSEQATRAEIRCPDPACNPYLTFAALLHAGLEGIEQGYELPDADGDEPLPPHAEQRRERGIVSLPETLGEAIDELRSRSCAQGARPAHLRPLRRAEAQGVGRLPRAAHRLGAGALPVRALEREQIGSVSPALRPADPTDGRLRAAGLSAARGRSRASRSWRTHATPEGDHVDPASTGTASIRRPRRDGEPDQNPVIEQQHRAGLRDKEADVDPTRGLGVVRELLADDPLGGPRA
jgi:hypothetical protein